MPLASRIFRLIQYDAGGERGIRYVPRQQEGVSSGATAGYAQDMDIMLYPNALITVRPQELPEDFDPMRIHQEHTFTTYTKHYYIGSERINSKLGTVKDLGILCEQMGGYDLVNEMNTRTQEANERLNNLYQNLDKELEIDSPYLYSTRHALVCGFKYHNPKMYDSYWYHPDHLGSSSFITNTTGEISQHMEYLPFGETLVEEHLNSHNSPFKFNAKEYDAETGNYYYGARYYDPKWSTFLTPDPALESYPGISPYAYTLNNPIKYVDPTGMYVESPDNEYKINKDGKIVQIRPTEEDFDLLYNNDMSSVMQLDKNALEKVENSTYLRKIKSRDKETKVHQPFQLIDVSGITSEKSESLFEFITQNTLNEFSNQKFKNDKRFIGTTFSSIEELSASLTIHRHGELTDHDHSHWETTLMPSPGDINIAIDFKSRGWNTALRVYSPITNKYKSYNSKSSSLHLEPVILKGNK